MEAAAGARGAGSALPGAGCKTSCSSGTSIGRLTGCNLLQFTAGPFRPQDLLLTARLHGGPPAASATAATGHCPLNFWLYLRAVDAFEAIPLSSAPPARHQPSHRASMHSYTLAHTSALRALRPIASMARPASRRPVPLSRPLCASPAVSECGDAGVCGDAVRGASKAGELGLSQQLPPRVRARRVLEQLGLVGNWGLLAGTGTQAGGLHRMHCAAPPCLLLLHTHTPRPRTCTRASTSRSCARRRGGPAGTPPLLARSHTQHHCPAHKNACPPCSETPSTRCTHTRTAPHTLHPHHPPPHRRRRSLTRPATWLRTPSTLCRTPQARSRTLP